MPLFRCTMQQQALMFVCALALVTSMAAQSLPQVTLPGTVGNLAQVTQSVRTLCNTSMVAAVNSTLARDVLAACGPPKNLTASFFCEECGIATAAALGPIIPPILAANNFTRITDLSDNCSEALFGYVGAAAGLDQQRIKSVADTCNAGGAPAPATAATAASIRALVAMTAGSVSVNCNTTSVATIPLNQTLLGSTFAACDPASNAANAGFCTNCGSAIGPLTDVLTGAILREKGLGSFLDLPAPCQTSLFTFGLASAKLTQQQIRAIFGTCF